jgi:hypothetical protein
MAMTVANSVTKQVMKAIAGLHCEAGMRGERKLQQQQQLTAKGRRMAARVA